MTNSWQKYDYNTPLPKKVYLHGFSPKPSMLGMIITIILIAAGLLLLGHLSLKAVDSGTKTRCLNWKQALKENSNLYLYAGDYETCKALNINLK